MAQLIVYFSRRGENYVSGRIQPLSVGNTEVVARRLQVLTGADLFQLEPVHPYSDNYNQCIEQAQADQRQDARPALRALPDHLEDYDTIYLGYPNYWGTMPMCVFTFLASFDFTGKTILPFCTHEGSGLGRSEADIRRLCPGARVGRGLAILGTAVCREEAALAAWVKRESNMTLQHLIQNSLFPVGEENTAYAPYFDGTSYLHMLSLDQVAVGNVTFAPGCRNHWHIHKASQGGGQILLVTAGRGYYQAWGQPPQELHPGDVVHIPPNVKHWHGAAPDSPFQHLAIEVPGQDTGSQWLEPVDPDEYNRLK